MTARNVLSKHADGYSESATEAVVGERQDGAEVVADSWPPRGLDRDNFYWQREDGGAGFY